MDFTKWKLLPGNSLVQLEERAANLGGIIIPEKYRARPTRVGRVVSSNMTGEDRARIGVDDLTGKRVIVDASLGRALDDTHYLYPNLHRYKQDGRKVVESPFLCIVPDGMKFGLGTQGTVARCRFCGPAKLDGESKANLMLVTGPRGIQYCPRCMRDETGSVVNPNDFDEAAREFAS